MFYMNENSVLIIFECNLKLVHFDRCLVSKKVIKSLLRVNISQIVDKILLCTKLRKIIHF